MGREKKNQRGITLIALVVTIIILLILAGVSLNLIAGSEGMLKKTAKAVEMNEKATAKEQANLLLGELAIQYYEEKYENDKDLGELDYYLQTELESGKKTSTGDFIIIVDEEGNVQVKKDENVILTGKLENGKILWEDKDVDFGKEDKGKLLYSKFDDKASYADVEYTILGDKQIKIANHSKVGNGSCYFSGTYAQRLNQTVPNLNFGTNDFTIEFWLYPETQAMSYVQVIGAEANNNFEFFLTNPEIGGNMGIWLGGSWIMNTKTYTQNEWRHYAIVRKNGIFTLYENGNAIGVSAEVYKSLAVDISNLAIGGDVSVSNTAYKGYMDDLAIYNYAKYTDTFTPSTEAKVDANILYSSFDTNISSKNASYEIRDSITRQLYTNLGNTKIYITEGKSKVGGKSVYFAGQAGQRLNQTVPNLNFGTNDFTIEFWIYPEEQVMSYALILGAEENNNFNVFLADASSGGNMSFTMGITRIMSAKTYTANEWNHYAVVRKDGIFTLYENGKVIGTSTETYKDWEVDFSNLSIGGNCSTTNTAYKGYMDDLAIYDYAKYTESFQIVK